MRSPIPYFGGKFYMIDTILPLFPPHHTYVEVFGGGASILFAKNPSPVEVYNDLNEGLVNFFRVLRDKEKAQELYRLASLTPYARTEYNHCRETWQDETDPTVKAWKWFVVARMSFSGSFGSSWRSAVGASTSGKSDVVNLWQIGIERLLPAAERLLDVQIESQDFRVILDRYDTSETLFYLDPPYIAETRRSGKYQHEMTDADHQEMVGILLQLKGKAILSGYDHEIYSPLESAGWKRIEKKRTCYSVAKTRATELQGEGACQNQYRTEIVWTSPSAEKQMRLF